ncbi:MAG: sugar porter family MFS transporter [Saprospiraceae bacterium]
MNNKYVISIAAVVALGGFLFGFDAAVISGVISFIRPEFDLTDIQVGWVVSSLTLTSTIAMAIAGPLSDKFGRKTVLISVGLLYAISAVGSALAPTYEFLVVARMLGGFAVGAALITAPLYIAEVSPAESRGQMVSINQLNIVLGFSAAYFANYYLLQLSDSTADWVTNLGINSETWRWMLGLEALPAIIFFISMFFVPESPRWLLGKNRTAEAVKTLEKINGKEQVEAVTSEILKNIQDDNQSEKTPLSELFKPAMKLVITIGIVIGVLQQITGINAVFFYATSIFEQSGVGQDASFAQAILVGLINVVFTLLAMYLIDKLGRKPLLLIGTAGIVISMTLTAYGFHQATYTLTQEKVEILSEDFDKTAITDMVGITYDNDVTYKNELKSRMSNVEYGKMEGDLIQAAITMNPILILIGILGFVASFAISLGPVMWVLFSELFPTHIRGLAISFVGFINSGVSWLVQQFFPWELANLGSALTFVIYGLFALFGFLFIYKMLPETKGKTLEEIEKELVG